MITKSQAIKEVEQLHEFKRNHPKDNCFEAYDYTLHCSHKHNGCKIRPNFNDTYISINILKIPTLSNKNHTDIKIPEILLKYKQDSTAVIQCFYHFYQCKEFIKYEAIKTKNKLPTIVFDEWLKLKELEKSIRKKTKTQPTSNHEILWLITCQRCNIFFNWMNWHESQSKRFTEREITDQFYHQYIRKAIWFTKN